MIFKHSDNSLSATSGSDCRSAAIDSVEVLERSPPRSSSGTVRTSIGIVASTREYSRMWTYCPSSLLISTSLSFNSHQRMNVAHSQTPAVRYVPFSRILQEIPPRSLFQCCNCILLICSSFSQEDDMQVWHTPCLVLVFDMREISCIWLLTIREAFHGAKEKPDRCPYPPGECPLTLSCHHEQEQRPRQSALWPHTGLSLLPCLSRRGKGTMRGGKWKAQARYNGCPPEPGVIVGSNGERGRVQPR